MSAHNSRRNPSDGVQTTSKKVDHNAAAAATTRARVCRALVPSRRHPWASVDSATSWRSSASAESRTSCAELSQSAEEDRATHYPATAFLGSQVAPASLGNDVTNRVTMIGSKAATELATDCVTTSPRSSPTMAGSMWATARRIQPSWKAFGDRARWSEGVAASRSCSPGSPEHLGSAEASPNIRTCLAWCMPCQASSTRRCPHIRDCQCQCRSPQTRRPECQEADPGAAVLMGDWPRRTVLPMEVPPCRDARVSGRVPLWLLPAKLRRTDKRVPAVNPDQRAVRVHRWSTRR